VLLLNQFATQSIKIHHVFSKQFDHIDAICDAELQYESKLLPKSATEGTVFKSIKVKDMTPVILGQDRDKVKEEALLEASYEQDGPKKIQKQIDDREREAGKGVIRVYGYKHHKSLKFYAQLLRCLKDCYEMKFEQLNIDMNFFLLLKNELSLNFLR